MAGLAAASRAPGSAAGWPGGCGHRRLGPGAPGPPASRERARRAGGTGGVPGGTSGRSAGSPPAGPRRHIRAIGGSSPAARAGGIGGGLGGNTQVSSAVTKLLTSGAAGYRWAAATVGAESAAPFQLASGEPVMAIGGFNGTDQAPTLAQFKTMVAAHEVHYFIGANGHTFGGGSGDAAQITSWVESHFTKQTVGGETVYNLTSPTSS